MLRKLTITILLVIALVGVGVVAYQALAPAQDTKLEGQRTFHSEQYGFSLNHPSSFQVSRGEEFQLPVLEFIGVDPVYQRVFSAKNPQGPTRYVAVFVYKNPSGSLKQWARQYLSRQVSSRLAQPDFLKEELPNLSDVPVWYGSSQEGSLEYHNYFTANHQKVYILVSAAPLEARDADLQQNADILKSFRFTNK